MTQMHQPFPLSDDYLRVRDAILFIKDHANEQPSLDEIADHVGLAPTEFHKLFRRWAGLTPKAFLQSLTLDHAKRLLDDSNSVLQTSLETGLSGGGRLHDLFVQFEALSPGEYARKGAGLTMHYGFHDCPFGLALLIVTKRGVAGLGFADGDHQREAALQDMKRRWPKATYIEDESITGPIAQRVFTTQNGKPLNPCGLF